MPVLNVICAAQGKSEIYPPRISLPGFKDPESSAYLRLGVKDKDQKSHVWAPVFDPVPRMALQIPYLICVYSFLYKIFFLDNFNWVVQPIFTRPFVKLI